MTFYDGICVFTRLQTNYYNSVWRQFEQCDYLEDKTTPNNPNQKIYIFAR